MQQIGEKCPTQEQIQQIVQIINKNNYKRVVLQMPKQYVPNSFDLVSRLRTACSQDVQFYVLYDSMKKPCCTDIIGAKHVDYHALFHFGYACFSQTYNPRHHYILPSAENQWKQLQQVLTDSKTLQLIKQNNINLIICDQSIYRRVKRLQQFLQQAHIQLALLPFDQNNHQYFGFCYYCNQIKNRNVLVIKPDQHFQGSNSNSQLLIQNLQLCKNALNIQKLYTLSPNQMVSMYCAKSSKRLLQRIAQISELQNYETFGILVSNPSTKFCQQQIRRVRNILDSKKLKHFTFMMNNLNECKLGNFPQIQVYVVISCYNYSLYNKKDFYRLVVAPYDIQVAFGQAKYQSYQFDLNLYNKQLKANKECKIDEQQIGKKQQEILQSGNSQENVKQKTDLIKVNNQVAVQNIIQTLSFYKGRQYKGLQFKEKKEVEKIKLGKIGTATGYKPIQQQTQTLQGDK